MNTLTKKGIILLTCIVLGITAVSGWFYQPKMLSNDPFLKGLKEKLATYQAHYQPDKVYVHLDKTMYEAGESIWFSAYVRDAQTLAPSDRSGIVYVELLDPKGSVVQKHTLIAQEGQAAGDFQLAADTKGGMYTLKAYTNWQRNQNTFFERSIQVQKVVLPNLNMELNFDQKAYGPTDEVSATLDLNTLTNTPLANHNFNYVVQLDGNQLKQGNGKTDEQGRANVSFKLPKRLETNDGLLNILLEYKGQTESISRSIPITLANIDLAFFPEGGQLIEGMICGMGFKAVDEFGKPADIQGEVVDETGKVVARFGSYHQGMGKFDFAPQAGHQYTAKITSPIGVDKQYTLPKIDIKGYALKVEKQTRKSIRLHVIASEAEQLYLVAQSRNTIHFSKVLEAQSGLNMLEIPTETLPIGITQLTLFDSQEVPRAERLVFVNRHKKLTIDVKTDKEKYLPREQVNMDIRVTDELGNPVQGNFSLAVIDDNLLTFADDKQGHILSSMLLEADLQGKIEEPNFYFDDEDDPTRLKPEVDRRKALDHLLMTQGWRKFVWKEVMDGELAQAKYKNERAIIAGKVIDEDGNGLAGAQVSIPKHKKVLKTDENGLFVINNLGLYEPTMLRISGEGRVAENKMLSDFEDNLTIVLQKGRRVSGVLTYKKKPAVGVRVNVAGTDFLAYTDHEGKYSIFFPQKYDKLLFSGGGYESKTVALKANQTTLNASLKEAVIQPTMLEAELQEIPARNMSDVKGRIMGGVANNNVAGAQPKRAEAKKKQAEKAKKRADAERRKAIPLDEVAEIEEEAPAEIDDKRDIKADIANVEVADVKQNRGVFAEKARKSTRYYRARTFYAPKYTSGKVPEVRSDFRSTIYWNPSVRTDENGQAAVSFYNSDDITQFRVTVEGLGLAGEIGRTEYKYFTQLPVEMLTKIPAEVLTGDKLSIPLTLTNHTSDMIEGKLTVDVPTHLALTKNPPSQLKLKANESKTIFLALLAKDELGQGKLGIAIDANGLSDKMLVDVDTRPRGFPVNEVFTGDQQRQVFRINIQDPLNGSVVAKLQAYPNTLDEVMSGMESMLRMPSGCFEQTSSSNYPNLLVLNYMRETNTVNAKLENQVKKYLAVGYKRLVGYESPSGGFDWWGRDPAHEALSAYGLMEFVDMQAVYNVDPKLISRTAAWLLSRRDGQGGWTKNPHALHSWANASVTDAYIVWALCEAGYGSEIKKELDKSYQDAIKSEDPYMMSLLANALLVQNDKRAQILLDELVKTQKKDGSFVGLTSSVTNSKGHSLKIETTSLAALAMMKAGGLKKEAADAIKVIQGGKTYYGYGSTQGTVLALKALLEHAKANRRPADDGELLVSIDGKVVETLAYKADQREVLMPDLAKHLKTGKQKVEVRYAKTKHPMPFDLELTYTTRKPDNDPKCVLGLETTLPKKGVKMGETLRLTAKVINKTEEGQPMTMAMVGIPAGLSVQPWQLKALQEKKVFDYYELFEGYVVLHYEQMKPSETKTVNLDLKADIPGTYEAPASSAFLYYTNEHRVWSQPKVVTIN